MHQPVAFVCAMPLEVIPLKRRLSLEKTIVGSLEVYLGTLGERPVVAIVTGIGGVHAANALERLLESYDVEHVVVVGIAGALDNATPIGTLVMPAVVVNGQTGADYHPHQLGAIQPRGTMWTSDHLITDPEAVSRLRESDVIALDMETAAIAAICQRRDIPWSVFRAISDRASEVSLDDEVFRLINRDGSYNLKKVAVFILKHPERLPALIRLARGAKIAARHASAAAVSAVGRLPRTSIE